MNIVDLRKYNKKIENQETPEKSKGENHLTEENIQQYINPERRKFLKFLLVGAGAFLAGFLTRFLSPASKFFSCPEKTESPTEKKFGNWNVVERRNQVTFIDKNTREEVLILDWGEEERD